MEIDASHLFPRDHFQLGIVQSKDEHRLVLRCSADFLDPVAAQKARLYAGRRAREIRDQLKDALRPEIASDRLASARFVDQLRQWALLPHHYSGQVYVAREAHRYRDLRSQLQGKTADLSRLLADFAAAYREHALARLRYEALENLGGCPGATKEEIHAGFIRHFNRFLVPATARPPRMDQTAERLKTTLDESRTPRGLVGYYPPRETLSDLDAHHTYFASDFDRVRQSGLKTDSVLEVAPLQFDGPFILRMHLSAPTTAKPVLFDRVQDVFARALQRMGFPVRIMPLE